MVTQEVQHIILLWVADDADECCRRITLETVAEVVDELKACGVGVWQKCFASPARSSTKFRPWIWKCKENDKNVNKINNVIEFNFIS